MGKVSVSPECLYLLFAGSDVIEIKKAPGARADAQLRREEVVPW